MFVRMLCSGARRDLQRASDLIEQAKHVDLRLCDCRY